MSNPFTDKSIRKILLSSPLQQRAGLTTMQHLILCPRNSRVCMYFGHRMGLMVRQTTLGKVNLVLLQTHLLSVPALPQSSTGKNHSCHEDPPPASSPVVPPHSSSPSIATNSSAKRKHSARQSIGSLPTFLNANANANDFMSISDAYVSSCSQTGTGTKQQKVNGPSALLSTSEELKEFNNTIKDLLKSKEANKRQE